jgi:hypothetical protein
LSEIPSHRLPDESVLVVGFGKKDLSVFEFNEVIMVEPMFLHRQFVWMSKPYVPVMLFYSGLDRAVCPMYTWPNSQVMLYTPGVISPRSSFIGRRKLEIFLGKPTLLMLCLASILLRRPYVV